MSLLTDVSAMVTDAETAEAGYMAAYVRESRCTDPDPAQRIHVGVTCDGVQCLPPTTSATSPEAAQPQPIQGDRWRCTSSAHDPQGYDLCGRCYQLAADRGCEHSSVMSGEGHPTVKVGEDGTHHAAAPRAGGEAETAGVDPPMIDKAPAERTPQEKAESLDAIVPNPATITDPAQMEEPASLAGTAGDDGVDASSSAAVPSTELQTQDATAQALSPDPSAPEDPTPSNTAVLPEAGGAADVRDGATAAPTPHTFVQLHIPTEEAVRSQLMDGELVLLLVHRATHDALAGFTMVARDVHAVEQVDLLRARMLSEPKLSAIVPEFLTGSPTADTLITAHGALSTFAAATWDLYEACTAAAEAATSESLAVMADHVLFIVKAACTHAAEFLECKTLTEQVATAKRLMVQTVALLLSTPPEEIERDLAQIGGPTALASSMQFYISSTARSDPPSSSIPVLQSGSDSLEPEATPKAVDMVFHDAACRHRDFFVSFAGPRRPEALVLGRVLCDRLAPPGNLGTHVFVDTETVAPGQQFDWIYRVAGKYAAGICLIEPEFFRRPACLQELAAFEEKELPLVLVLLEPTSDCHDAAIAAGLTETRVCQALAAATASGVPGGDAPSPDTENWVRVVESRDPATVATVSFKLVMNWMLTEAIPPLVAPFLHCENIMLATGGGLAVPLVVARRRMARLGHSLTFPEIAERVRSSQFYEEGGKFAGSEDLDELLARQAEVERAVLEEFEKELGPDVLMGCRGIATMVGMQVARACERLPPRRKLLFDHRFLELKALNERINAAQYSRSIAGLKRTTFQMCEGELPPPEDKPVETEPASVEFWVCATEDNPSAKELLFHLRGATDGVLPTSTRFKGVLTSADVTALAAGGETDSIVLGVCLAIGNPAEAELCEVAERCVVKGACVAAFPIFGRGVDLVKDPRIETLLGRRGVEWRPDEPPQQEKEGVGLAPTSTPAVIKHLTHLIASTAIQALVKDFSSALLDHNPSRRWRLAYLL